jgi:hypothetical protein
MSHYWRRPVSKTQTGTFFNEQWNKENQLDILLAKEQTRQANAARGPELRLELAQTPLRRECLEDGSDCGSTLCPLALDDPDQLDRIEAADEFDDGTIEQWEGYFNRD